MNECLNFKRIFVWQFRFINAMCGDTGDWFCNLVCTSHKIIFKKKIWEHSLELPFVTDVCYQVYFEAEKLSIHKYKHLSFNFLSDSCVFIWTDL